MAAWAAARGDARAAYAALGGAEPLPHRFTSCIQRKMQALPSTSPADWSWREWGSVAALSACFYYGQTRGPVWKDVDEENAELLYARFLAACPQRGSPLRPELPLSTGSLWRLVDEGAALFFRGSKGLLLPIFDKAEAASVDELLLSAAAALSLGQTSAAVLLLHAGRSVEVQPCPELLPALEELAPASLRRAKRPRDEQ